ncbi:MAG: hypothetical protein IJC18_04620 [Clostridia bacterium]|nr:hypothetical protein [Clostridia bacterium]
MHDDRIINKIIPPASGDLNEHCALNLSGYHQMLCMCVEGDMTDKHQSTSVCISRGFAWALTSITLDVYKPITSCEPVTARTWVSSDKPPYNRREVLFTGSDGEEILRATLFSVPLDVNTHRILKDRERLGDDPFARGEILIPDATSRISEPKDYARVAVRDIMPSDIDALGHLNNCRYGALIYDNILPQHRKALSSPFRYVIDFRRQLPPDSSVEIPRCVADNGVVYIKGIIPESGKLSFSSVIYPKTAEQ